MPVLLLIVKIRVPDRDFVCILVIAVLIYIFAHCRILLLFKALSQVISALKITLYCVRKVK